MNPVEQAIRHLHHTIPQPILNAAFLDRQGFGQFQAHNALSVDERIRQTIVQGRVLPDCNLVGGITTTIYIGNIQPQYLPEYKMVWSIPLQLTENRRITQVYSLVYGHGGAPHTMSHYDQGGSYLSDLGQSMYDSHMPIPDISNAKVDLVGENTVMAHTHLPSTPHLHLRALLENDEVFSHLKPASIPVFYKLVEYAVKAYIYNTLIIQIDEAYLVGGQPLGRFLSIIENYADANELYEETFHERWRKVALFNDSQARQRHIQLVTGGRY